MENVPNAAYAATLASSLSDVRRAQCANREHKRLLLAQLLSGYRAKATNPMHQGEAAATLGLGRHAMMAAKAHRAQQQQGHHTPPTKRQRVGPGETPAIHHAWPLPTHDVSLLHTTDKTTLVPHNDEDALLQLVTGDRILPMRNIFKAPCIPAPGAVTLPDLDRDAGDAQWTRLRTQHAPGLEAVRQAAFQQKTSWRMTQRTQLRTSLRRHLVDLVAHDMEQQDKTADEITKTRKELAYWSCQKLLDEFPGIEAHIAWDHVADTVKGCSPVECYLYVRNDRQAALGTENKASRVAFTAMDDARIVQAANTHQGHDWERVARALGNKQSAVAYMQRFQRCLNTNMVKVRRKWTQEEDARMVQGLLTEGLGEYQQTTRFLRHRTSEQIADRWRKLRFRVVPATGTVVPVPPWSESERQHLLLACMAYPVNDFVWHTQHVLRPEGQIRSMVHNLFDRKEARGQTKKLRKWTKAEDKRLVALAIEHDYRWATIAEAWQRATGDVATARKLRTHFEVLADKDKQKNKKKKEKSTNAAVSGAARHATKLAIPYISRRTHNQSALHHQLQADAKEKALSAVQQQK